MRILVAEDETIIRLDLREILERAGFEVCAEARDGEEAVELALSEKPDLAILDVKMPRLDGIDAARRILGERPIPIVILPAYAPAEVVERAKGLLMAREGLSEQDAFARLRRASQVSGRPMRVVAEALIATFGES
jgi:AmiR/NasT family two-component response regulator